MRLAYLDCASGISGDMMLGALVDAGVELSSIQSLLDSLALPSCRLIAQEVKKNGVRATQIVVEHEPEHVHRHLHDIVAMIEGSALEPEQQDLAKEIFTISSVSSLLTSQTLPVLLFPFLSELWLSFQGLPSLFLGFSLPAFWHFPRFLFSLCLSVLLPFLNSSLF